MLEVLAECDDALMEKYFDDPATITEDEIRVAIRKGTIAMQINPMICGSSFKNKGGSDVAGCSLCIPAFSEDAEAIEGTDPRDPDTVVVLVNRCSKSR